MNYRQEVTQRAVYIRNESDKPVTLVLESGDSYIVAPGAEQSFENVAIANDDMERLKGPDPNRPVKTFREAFEEVLDLYPIAFKNMA